MVRQLYREPENGDRGGRRRRIAQQKREAVIHQHHNMRMDIEVIDYRPIYQEDFKRLNLEWISKYFEVEGPDLQQLDHPEEYILAKGGRIYLARTGDQIIGTITLKKDS